MREEGFGKALAWMATGAAVLAAGALVGATAGRRPKSGSVSRGQAPEESEPDLTDRPVARAAWADATAAARRTDRLAATLSGLEARLERIERASAADQIEAVWQKVLRIEERLEQAQQRSEIPALQELVSQAESRISPRLTALESRAEQHAEAIRQLQAQATQTETNLQKMIAAVEKLTAQLSRALPPAPMRIEPRREGSTAASMLGEPAAPSAAPEVSPETARPSDRPPRWKAVALAGAITLGSLGSWVAIRSGDLFSRRPAVVVAADTPVARVDAAIVSLARLVEQQPEEIGWMYELGRLHALKQDWTGAERWYRVVLERDPHDPRALRSLADLSDRRYSR